MCDNKNNQLVTLLTGRDIAEAVRTDSVEYNEEMPIQADSYVEENKAGKDQTDHVSV